MHSHRHTKTHSMNVAYNDDIGYAIQTDSDERELTASFDEHLVPYAVGGLDELVLCYATIIHNSQGLEYPAVVVPPATWHYMLFKHNLIDADFTHSKRLVVLVGQKRAGASS